MEDHAESKSATRSEPYSRGAALILIIASASWTGRCRVARITISPCSGASTSPRIVSAVAVPRAETHRRKIAVRPTEEGGELQRERDGSIDILMKAVIIPGPVTE